MSRIITEIITSEYDGMPLFNYLRQKEHLSRKQIASLKYIEGSFELNGQAVRTSALLHLNDRLVIHLTDGKDQGAAEWLRPEDWLPPLEILYEDEDLILVNKPSGLPCHPGHGHYADTLANQVAWHLYGANVPGDRVSGKVFLVSRLDRDTCGIVLFAKNKEAAAKLQKQIHSGQCHKTYKALVHGVLDPGKHMDIDKPIAANPKELNRMIACDTDSDPNLLTRAREAVTHVDVLETHHGTSLIECRLTHGRTHQIRVHLSSEGYPLVGDAIYGRREDGLRLCAYRMDLVKPFTSEPLSVEITPYF